jgi:hypothetical protein
MIQLHRKRRVIAIGFIAALMAGAFLVGRGILSRREFRTDLPDSTQLDQTFVGSYYLGDGLGVNQILDLNADGTFHCSWYGCLGDYGRTSGIWGRKEQQLFLAIRSANGMFKTSPLSDLRIVVHDERRYLLPKNFEDAIAEHGNDMIPMLSFSLRTLKNETLQ